MPPCKVLPSAGFLFVLQDGTLPGFERLERALFEMLSYCIIRSFPMQWFIQSNGSFLFGLVWPSALEDVKDLQHRFIWI